MQEKAELFKAIGSHTLELWCDYAVSQGMGEASSTLYAQHSAGLWQRLWAATDVGQREVASPDDPNPAGVDVHDGEGVAVLLLRCLTVIYGRITTSAGAQLLSSRLEHK
jgi:hypothetical protein